jgi:hypothetical protein
MVSDTRGHIFAIIGPFSDVTSRPYTVRVLLSRFVRNQNLENLRILGDVDRTAEKTHQAYGVCLECSGELEGCRDVIVARS